MINQEIISSDGMLENDIANVANITTIDFDDAVDPKEQHLKDALSIAHAVIENCKENPGSLFEPEFIKAVTSVRALSQKDWANIRVSIKQNKPSGILLADIDSQTDPAKNGQGRNSDADIILEMLEERPLYHDENADKTFIEDDERVFRIGSQPFTEWISHKYFKEFKRSVNESSIKQVAFTLTGHAKHEGIKKHVYMRMANHQDVIYNFIGDEDCQIIKITSTGWSFDSESDIKFWKPGSMLSLPMPISGGKIEEIWEYLNISGKDDRLLILAWMLEAFRSETPFPVLALNGLQGCAKSSTHARIRMLIDPSGCNLRVAPKDIQDIYIGAGSNWIVSFENISRLTPQQQDALCTLATGGGFATRTLYTNDDETIINVKRPVIINSIPVVITAQDLTDRVINIELQRLEMYRDEIEINAAFETARPRLFGALLDLLAKTLAILPQVKINKPPRMADFARLGEAMAQAMGYEAGEFDRVFKENRRESISRAMEASPVAVAIREMAENCRDETVFHGTVKELFDKLKSDQPSLEGWPRSPRGLGDVIRRQTPALDSIGIHVKQGGVERIGSRRGVSITIKKISPGNDGNIGNVVSEYPPEESKLSESERVEF